MLCKEGEAKAEREKEREDIIDLNNEKDASFRAEEKRGGEGARKRERWEERKGRKKEEGRCLMCR